MLLHYYLSRSPLSISLLHYLLLYLSVFFSPVCYTDNANITETGVNALVAQLGGKLEVDLRGLPLPALTGGIMRKAGVSRSSTISHVPPDN